MVKKKTTAGTSEPRITTATAIVASAHTAPRTAASPAALLSEVRELILQTRQTVSQGVNSALAGEVPGGHTFGFRPSSSNADITRAVSLTCVSYAREDIAAPLGSTSRLSYCKRVACPLADTSRRSFIPASHRRPEHHEASRNDHSGSLHGDRTERQRYSMALWRKRWEDFRRA